MNRAGAAIIVIAALALAGSIAYEFYKTTTSHDQKTMELQVPDGQKANNIRPDNPKTTVTVLLGRNNFIYAYRGSDITNGKILDTASVREYLLNIKKDIPQNDLVVMIKTAPDASYQSTASILDEMTGIDIKRYAVVDMPDAEKRMVDSLLKQ